MTFVETNNLLNSEKHGFRKFLSYTTNLLIARTKWIEALGNEKLANIVCIDLRKAFDKVLKSRLILKLENIGITGPLQKWLKDFLVVREQKLKINSKCFF